MISEKSLPPTSDTAMRYHFLMPVWNPDYVKRFVEVGLPSQLAPGNLPSLPLEKCFYQIFTREADVEGLRSAASFKRLEQLIPVSIEMIDESGLENPYGAMTACYEAGIRTSAGIDAAFVFLTPDTIWSDGSFENMHYLQQRGKRAVLLVGLRMCESGGIEPLKQQFAESSGQVLAVPSRQLIKHCLRHLHPLSLAHICDEQGNRSLGHYYYRVGQHGLLARCIF